MCSDFPTKNQFQYGIVHIYFTNSISEELMNLISQNKFLVERIKTFKEYYLDFSCKWDNIFNLDMPKSFEILFSSSSSN